MQDSYPVYSDLYPYIKSCAFNFNYSANQKIRVFIDNLILICEKDSKCFGSISAIPTSCSLLPICTSLVNHFVFF